MEEKKSLKEFNNKIIANSLKIINVILALIIIFQDVRDFNVFPSPFYKYIILLLLFFLIFYYVKTNRKIKIDLYFIVPILISYLISVIFSWDKSIFVPMMFFPLEITAFILYIKYFENLNEAMKNFSKVLFFSSIILCGIGYIQFIAHKLGIKYLYDFSIYGIIPSGYTYLEEGRYYSIYAEPAHLCGIIFSAMFLSYYYLKNTSKKRYIFYEFFALGFGILTRSVVTYIGIIAALILIIIYYFYNRKDKEKNKKRNIAILSLIAVAIFIVIAVAFKTNFMNSLNDKIINFFSNNSNNAYLQSNTTFALKSNFNISVAKMKDGYIFGTGIFSNKVHYGRYINELYPQRYQGAINDVDAASMFTRVFSEWGIVGFILLIILLIWNLAIALKQKNILMIFYEILFIVQGLRLGEYNWILILLPFMFVCENISAYYKNRIKVEDKK